MKMDGILMTTLQNEEIMAMRTTVAMLRKGIPLEPNQRKRLKMKQSVKELEELIEKKLNETTDFADIRVEEDVY